MSIFRIWKERNKILEGILNSVFKKEHVEEVANERLQKCATCLHLDIQGTQCYVLGTQPCCELCGCSLKWKTRSLSSDCPGGFWDAILSEEEEDALNEKIKHLEE